MTKVYHLSRTLAHLTDPKLVSESKESAEIVVLGGQKINISQFPNLKVIFRVGIGDDGIQEKLKDTNVRVVFPSLTTSALIRDETAKFSASLILRAIYEGRTGNFAKWIKEPRGQISDQRVLIIGNGRIGQGVKSLVSPFCMVDTFDLRENQKEEFLPKVRDAHVISIHVPGETSDPDMFGDTLFSNLRNETRVINTSRGNLLKEGDVLRAIGEKQAKFFLDVFPREPYSGDLEKHFGTHVFPTPHVAGYTNEYLLALLCDLLAVIDGLD